MEVNVSYWLEPRHCDVPLHALRYRVTRLLGMYLDKEVQDIHFDAVPGDFGGLAELVGFDGLEIQSFEREQYKGKKVLDEWKNRADLHPTVGKLVEYLMKMGRIDILTDLIRDFLADIEIFMNHQEDFNKNKQAPIQDETVSQGPGSSAEIPDLITMHDVTRRTQTFYDAFICYNPFGESGQDMDFVREMIRRFESPPLNLRLFVPHRDNLAGLNTHNITAAIISERCRHMIVVLSHNFLLSEAADFQSSFAFALSPGARNRRIVPVRLDGCPTPNIMLIMAMCDFTKRDLLDWSWERLAKSISNPVSQDDFVLEPRDGFSESVTPTTEHSACSQADSDYESTPRSQAQLIPSSTAPVSEYSRQEEVTLPFRTVSENSSSNPNLSLPDRFGSIEKSSSNPALNLKEQKSVFQKITRTFKQIGKKKT